MIWQRGSGLLNKAEIPQLHYLGQGWQGPCAPQRCCAAVQCPPWLDRPVCCKGRTWSGTPPAPVLQTLLASAMGMENCFLPGTSRAASGVLSVQCPRTCFLSCSGSREQPVKDKLLPPLLHTLCAPCRAHLHQCSPVVSTGEQDTQKCHASLER